MKKVIGLIELFIWNSKLRISRSMEYRVDFISGLFISMVYSFVGPVTQYLLFTQTKGYPGWNINQVLLFQGVLLIWTGLRNMAFGDLRSTVENIVENGGFDRFLLKPYPAIGVLLTGCFNLNSIGTVLSGAVITVYYASVLQVKISIISVGLVLAAMVCTTILYIALLIIFSGVVVVMVRIGRIWEMLDALLRFGEYPVEIFPRALQLVFLIFFPIALFVYFPTQILLQRLEIIYFVAFISCMLLLWLSLRFWNLCLKRYTSAGG